MNATQRIRLGLLLTNLKLGGRFSFRTFVNDKDYPKDPDPKNWRTINGSKVHLSNGKIDGGAGEKFKGNEWHGKVAHGSNSFFPPKGWVKPPPPPKEPPKAPEPDPFTPEVVSLPKKQAKVGLPGQGTHYANMLKGSYKNASPEVKNYVDEAFKKAGKMHSLIAQQGAFIDPLGIDNTSDAELAQKVFEAAKNKQITPLAAKNVVAALAAKKHSLVTNFLKKEMGMQGSAATPAATPPVAKSATTTSEKQAYEKEAEKILKDIDDDPFSAHEMLYKKGFSDKEAEDIVNAYYDEPEAVTTSKIIEGMKKNNIPVGTATGGKTKNDIDLTEIKKISEHYEDMSDEKQELYQKKFANELGITKKQADYLLINLQMPGFTDEKAIGKIVEWNPDKASAGVKAQKEAIAQTLSTEGPKAKAAGLMQTPNTCSVDLSEKATGIKTPKGTLNLVAAKGSAGNAKITDPAFKNFEKDQASQIDKLTKKQKAAIWRYTAGSTHTMKFLVYGETDDYFDDGGSDSYKYKKQGYTNPYAKGMTAAAIQKVCDDISAGLKKVKHPDMWVSRAASLMDWAGPDKQNGVTLDELKAMAKSGDVFENKAFLSTSPSEVPTFSLSGSSPVCRRFFVPKKAAGAYVESISQYEGCHENEFLLDKKTKTRIMKVEEVNGVIYTYEEVVA